MAEQRIKKEKIIIFICWLTYTVAYIGRLNYSASIVSIISDMGITKSAAGLVSSFFFFAYGIGQLVNGILSKRYNSRIMVFSALFISSIINILMVCCENISIMKFIWLLNGCVQSILWSTLIKTISEFVSNERIASAIFVMSTPNTVGTFLVYGLSAFNVRFFSWKTTFYTASILLMITAFVWFYLYGKASDIKLVIDFNSANKKNNKISKVMIFSLAFIALSGIANGFIKDGINTWVPSVLYEEFNMSQSFSILLTLLLPLVATFGAGLTKIIHDKIESHNTLNLLFYTVSAIFCGCILLALKIHSLILIMILFISLACLMAMINNVITSMYPLDCREYLPSGFAAGLLNTFCYVGSTLTSYSLGSVAQVGGWNSVFYIMLAVCAAGVILAFVGSRIKIKK